MGKSTFSADLFYQYINKYNQRNIPFPINILYLGDSGVIDKIVDLSKKEDACESILILDALDENVDATKDTSSFMNKIDLITNIFKFVIITGRTQLFQDGVSEPTIGKIKQNSNLSKRLKYEGYIIMTVNPDINLMNIVKNCTSVDDAVEFVSELTEKIKNSGLKIRCNIVVSFRINDTEFVYLLNTNNIYSQINTCLSKMYNLKSSKITS